MIFAEPYSLFDAALAAWTEVHAHRHDAKFIRLWRSGAFRHELQRAGVHRMGSYAERMRGARKALLEYASATTQEHKYVWSACASLTALDPAKVLADSTLSDAEKLRIVLDALNIQRAVNRGVMANNEWLCRELQELRNAARKVGGPK